MATLRQPSFVEQWRNYVKETLSLRKIPQLVKSDGKQEISDEQLEMLTNTIETEIIPRLMLAHRMHIEPLSESINYDWRPSKDDVKEFARILVTQDVFAASSYVQVLLQKGIALETVFIYLFMPSAQLLGEYWEEDVSDFSEVTIGLSKLQQLLRQFSPSLEPSVKRHSEKERRALVMTTPGDQHTFGTFMVEEFFRRAGWYVPSPYTFDDDNPAKIVSNNWFEVVGFSLSTGSLFDKLKSCISDIRKDSKNPAIGVMVGGAFFLENPDLVKKVGADATAIDGLDALVQAEDIVAAQDGSAKED